MRTLISAARPRRLATLALLAATATLTLTLVGVTAHAEPDPGTDAGATAGPDTGAVPPAVPDPNPGDDVDPAPAPEDPDPGPPTDPGTTISRGPGPATQVTLNLQKLRDEPVYTVNGTPVTRNQTMVVPAGSLVTLATEPSFGGLTRKAQSFGGWFVDDQLAGTGNRTAVTIDGQDDNEAVIKTFWLNR